jgi:maleate isomerase
MTLRITLSRRKFGHALAGATITVGSVPAAVSIPSLAYGQAVGWRGVVGIVEPAYSSGDVQDLIGIIPEGIQIIPVYLGFTKGTKSELTDSIPRYEQLVKILAQQNCNIIHPEGAPPFMILGREKEANLTASWAKEYNTQVFTSSQNAVNAIRALQGKKIVGISYFPDDLNKIFSGYLASAGINLLAMKGLPVAFDKVKDVPSKEVYGFIKEKFMECGNADCIYILGSAWGIMDIIEPLEQDLQVPVVYPVTARSWEIQKRLNINQPLNGYGRLLSTLPPLPVS